MEPQNLLLGHLLKLNRQHENTNGLPVISSRAGGRKFQKKKETIGRSDALLIFHHTRMCFSGAPFVWMNEFHQSSWLWVSLEISTSDHFSLEISTSEHFSLEISTSKHFSLEISTSGHSSLEISTSKHFSLEISTSEHFSPEISTSKTFL